MTIRNAKNFKNNQQRGKDLENRFIEYLQREGFWAHFMHPAPDGSQPFDIIACKGGLVYAFDCKTLSGNRFPLERAEYNQVTAFEIMNRKGNLHTYFIIEVQENVVRCIPSQYVAKCIKEGKKSIQTEGWRGAYIGCE